MPDTCPACGQQLPEPRSPREGRRAHWWVEGSAVDAACGADVDWQGNEVTTTNPHHVTCPACRKTKAWLDAINYQRAPFELEVPNAD